MRPTPEGVAGFGFRGSVPRPGPDGSGRPQVRHRVRVIEPASCPRRREPAPSETTVGGGEAFESDAVSMAVSGGGRGGFLRRRPACRSPALRRPSLPRLTCTPPLFPFLRFPFLRLLSHSPLFADRRRPRLERSSSVGRRGSTGSSGDGAARSVTPELGSRGAHAPPSRPVGCRRGRRLSGRAAAERTSPEPADPDRGLAEPVLGFPRPARAPRVRPATRPPDGRAHAAPSALSSADGPDLDRPASPTTTTGRSGGATTDREMTASSGWCGGESPGSGATGLLAGWRRAGPVEPRPGRCDARLGSVLRRTASGGTGECLPPRATSGRPSRSRGGGPGPHVLRSSPVRVAGGPRVARHQSPLGRGLVPAPSGAQRGRGRRCGVPCRTGRVRDP